jgi:hypothetical protein
MKWRKASEKMPQDLTGGPQPMRGSVLPYRVNGNHVVGRFHYRNDCYFFEYVGMNMHGSMMRSEFHKIEWRDDSDESLPTDEQLQAEAEERAEKYFSNVDWENFEVGSDGFKAYEKAWVAGASQYAGRVRDLQSEVAYLTEQLEGWKSQAQYPNE